jgi:hypothetical protein
MAFGHASSISSIAKKLAVPIIIGTAAELPSDREE